MKVIHIVPLAHEFLLPPPPLRDHVQEREFNLRNLRLSRAKLRSWSDVVAQIAQEVLDS